MKKSILIAILVLFVLCGIATAFPYTPLDYYQLEADGTDDGSSPIGLIEENSPTYVTGKVNNAINLSGNDVVLTNSSYGVNAPNIRTIDVWFKPSDYCYTNTCYIIQIKKDVDDMIYLSTRPDETINFIVNRNGGNQVEMYSTTLAQADVWMHVVVTFGNTSGASMWINGGASPEATDADTEVMDADFNSIEIGRRIDTQDYDFDGVVDNIGFFTQIYNETTVSESYNAGNGLNFLAGGGGGSADDTLNISETYPVDSQHINTLFLDVNASVNSSEIFNCSLYYNDVLNQTKVDFASGNDVIVNFTLEFSSSTEEEFNYSISCVNNETQENTTNTTVFIDNVEPQLDLSDTLNNSISFNTLIQSNINITDTNLYAINITVDSTTIIFNSTSIESPYIYNLSFNPTDFGITEGVHTLEVWTSDTHTALAIPDYSYSKDFLSKAITYEFNKGWVKVKPTNKGIFSDFNTWKETDRYSFEFVRDFTAKLIYGTDIEFRVTSSDYIDIIEDSEYQGHLVIYELQKWIDFETNYRNAEVSVSRVDDYTVDVFITGIESDDIVFNSIGGLNIVNKNYTFYYGNVTESYTTPALETQVTEFFINFTINSSFVNDINGFFYYNGTSYTPTKTTTSNYITLSRDINSSLIGTDLNYTNLTFYWVWNATDASYNNITNTTDEGNQTIYRMIVSNCTQLYPEFNYTLNFTTINKSNMRVNTTVEASFEVWNDSTTLTRTYNYKYYPDEYHQFCIFPDWTNSLNTNYQIQFTATGYDTKSFVVSNEKLNNTLTSYELELTLTGDSTSITTNVVDENDNELVNYVVKVYKYDLGTGTYTLTDSKTTNSNGQAVFNLDVSTDEYKFEVYNPEGVLKYTEPKQLLTTTSYTFRIILGTSIEDITIKLQNLDYDLAVDKTTKNFTLVWDDSPTNLIDSINLTIVKTNVTEDVIIYSDVSTDDVGNFYYNVSANGVYIAKVYILSSEDSNYYFMDSISLDIRQAYDLFGTDALIMAFIFIFTMTFVGLAFSGEVALLLTILGMFIFWILGFLQVSISGIVAILISSAIIAFRLKKER